MTYIEQAIKEAVDAKVGWHSDYRTSGSSTTKLHSDIFIDPAFWQALGKARGWFTKKDQCGGYDASTTYQTVREAQKRCSFCNWHRFIDHLAEGKDAESFFKNL